MKDTANVKATSESEPQKQKDSEPTQSGPAESTLVPALPPLTPEENNRLTKLEGIIDAGLADFFAVGAALLDIKKHLLFREIDGDFNVYCQQRWGFGRSYANKLIGSAERISLLSEDQLKPTNEFQVRPFLSLKPEAFVEKWPAIVDAAGKKTPTSAFVQDYLKLAPRTPKYQKIKTSERKKRIKELLANIRGALKDKKVEEAMDQLSKLEKLLKV